MRIAWSPLAIQRVHEAAEQIALDQPEAARRWAREAFKAAGRLADFPYCGRVVPELGRSEVRELIYGVYRIIYRVSPQEVLVLTVRHGRQLIDETELKI